MFKCVNDNRLYTDSQIFGGGDDAREDTVRIVGEQSI
jgi:hypothetical protein